MLLDILGQIKYIIKANFIYFILFFKNVAPRKIQITYVCLPLYLYRTVIT